MDAADAALKLGLVLVNTFSPCVQCHSVTCGIDLCMPLQKGMEQEWKKNVVVATVLYSPAKYSDSHNKGRIP